MSSDLLLCYFRQLRSSSSKTVRKAFWNTGGQDHFLPITLFRTAHPKTVWNSGAAYRGLSFFKSKSLDASLINSYSKYKYLWNNFFMQHRKCECVLLFFDNIAYLYFSLEINRNLLFANLFYETQNANLYCSDNIASILTFKRVGTSL